MGPEGIIFLIPIAGIGAGCLFMVGAYKLLVRWLDRKRLPDLDLTDEVDRLRGEVESMTDVSLRVQELEERLDFAERLLAQQKHDGLASG